MIIKELLTDFYLQNGIPENGGEENDTFVMKMFGFSVTLLNPEFRKKATYIHDLQHVLHNKDTSWKGEGFIAGWEISTGMWKHFLLGSMSLWAMGYSFWLHPKAVFRGFRKGLNDFGIIDLKIKKEDFMLMDREELISLTSKNIQSSMGVFPWIQFLFWTTISQSIFLFPAISLISILIIIN
jgi:hypothetical protein